MQKFIKKKFLSSSVPASLALMFLLFSMFSCSFYTELSSSSDLKDISGNLTYRTILSKAYMGGSVLYNSSDIANSQLAEGVCVAVRLGELEAESDGDEIIYTDNESNASYGYLKIESINSKNLTFKFTEYSSDGFIKSESSFSLDENQFADLNGDGFFDVKYSKPLSKRAGCEKSMWLTFLSSQEELRTSMFSVLTEQYKNDTYPAGLMGINTDGKFVVTKYEANSSARSAVKGVAGGDYILDGETGEYYKIKSNVSYKNARSIDDSDIEVEENNLSEVDFYFNNDDFSNGYNAFEFLSALPKPVTENFSSEKIKQEPIEVLNEILLNKSLVEICSADLNIDIEEEVKETLRIIDTLSEYELAAFNRLFLSDTYSYICPPVDYNCADITEVLPLAHVNLTDCNGSSEELENAETLAAERSASSDTISIGEWKNIGTSGEAGYKLAKSYKEYLADIDELKDVVKDGKKITLPNFSKKIRNKDLGIELPEHTTATFFEINASPYLYFNGDFSISWSQYEAEASAHVLLTSYARAYLKCKFSKSLLEDYKKKHFEYNGSFHIGPIPFKYGLKIDFDIPYTVSGELKSNDYMYMGFAGLAGAGVDLGARYGCRKVKWFKIWRKWIYRPQFYFSPYMIPNGKIAKFTSFMGIANNEETPGIEISTDISPFIETTPYLGIGGDVGNIRVSTPIRETISLRATFFPNGTIEGIITNNFKIDICGGFKLDLPIVGTRDKDFVITNKYDKDFDFIKMKLN